MKQNIFLFHRFDKHASDHFNIKNVILRNKNIQVQTRGYGTEASWSEFVSSFITSYSKIILENNIKIDPNFDGFILMYDDTILEQRVILTDLNAIIAELSS
jgi:hypothetical protein